SLPQPFQPLVSNVAAPCCVHRLLSAAVDFPSGGLPVRNVATATRSFMLRPAAWARMRPFVSACITSSGVRLAMTSRAGIRSLGWSWHVLQNCSYNFRPDAEGGPSFARAQAGARKRQIAIGAMRAPDSIRRCMSSRRLAIRDAVAAKGSKPKRLSDLHRARGVVELRIARLFQHRSYLQRRWIDPHGSPAVPAAEVLRSDELSGRENRPVGRPAEVVWIEIHLDARTLALPRQRHAIDFARAVGIHIDPLAVVRGEDTVVAGELCARHFGEALSRGPQVDDTVDPPG